MSHVFLRGVGTCKSCLGTRQSQPACRRARRPAAAVAADAPAARCVDRDARVACQAGPGCGAYPGGPSWRSSAPRNAAAWQAWHQPSSAAGACQAEMKPQMQRLREYTWQQGPTAAEQALPGWARADSCHCAAICPVIFQSRMPSVVRVASVGGCTCQPGSCGCSLLLQVQQPGGFPRQSGPGQPARGQPPAQQHMSSQSSSPKIDPSQIPRPADRVTSRETAEFETRQDGHHAVPPSAQVRC